MIINQTENNVISISNDKHMKFGIDEGNFSLVYKSFLNYSNPIGSIVREITSNCFDSHIEAGIDKPVRIVWRDEDRLSGVPASISFIDEGIGMSEERVENVYCKFFTSTKRDTNSQIGGFGIGAKTPLSYVDMFSVITVSDGIEYHYSVHKGSSSPEMTLLSKIKTDKLNGTEIRINVKFSDKPLFFSEIEKQLKYFDNVQVENFGMLGQEKKIYHGKNFVFSDVNKQYRYDEMDLCIGKVRYPLDKSAFNNLSYLQKQALSMPVGLKFEIGDISVTWNRESVEYTEETKNKILSKLDNVIVEITGIFEEQSKQPTNIEELIAAPTFKEISIGESTITLNWMSGRITTPFLKIKNFDFEKSDVSAVINQYLIPRDAIVKNRRSQKSYVSFAYSKHINLRGYLFDKDERLNEKTRWILSKRNNHPFASWKYADLTKVKFDYPSDFSFALSKEVLNNQDESRDIEKEAQEAFDEFVRQVVEFADKEIERLVNEKMLIPIKNVVFSKQEEDAFVASKQRSKKKANEEMRIEYYVSYYNSKLIKPGEIFKRAKDEKMRVMIVDIYENREIASDIRTLLNSQQVPAAYMCVGKSRVLDVLNEENYGISVMTCEQFSKSKLLRRIRQRIRDHVEKQECENHYKQILDEVCYKEFKTPGVFPKTSLLELGKGLEPNPEIKRFYEKAIGERVIEKRRQILLHWDQKKLDLFFGKDSGLRSKIDTLKAEIELLPKHNPKYEYRRFKARIASMDSAKIGDDPKQ